MPATTSRNRPIENRTLILKDFREELIITRYRHLQAAGGYDVPASNEVAALFVPSACCWAKVPALGCVLIDAAPISTAIGTTKPQTKGFFPVVSRFKFHGNYRRNWNPNTPRH